MTTYKSSMAKKFRAMASSFTRKYKLILFVVATLLTVQSQAVNFTPLPPYLTETKGSPMVMLNMSKDHQLFFKAYNEFSDLDGDGVIETTYKHSYKYYGYFDNQRCYNYNTSDNRYVPVGKVDALGYCTNGTAANNWNGNFMNWASMARMDVIRRILYGGFRAVDTATAATPSVSVTVLERAHLPSDAHAFAKYYYGTDINKLTPFNPPQTAFTIATSTGTATVTAAQITLCNVSYGNGNAPANTNDDAPSILVAEGNHQLWAANERWQCYWRERKDASNGNSPAVTGINASSRNPRRTDGGGTDPRDAAKALGTGYDAGSYTARVEVCKTGLTGGFTADENARCRLYPRGNYKPVGLLQRYGERNEAGFGLITGSFDKNVSGGVLRKNIESFANELDLDDGQFRDVDGIIRTLNRLKVTGYDYGSGTYEGLVGGCNYQMIGLVDGECRSWGNPLGEMYLESLRYLAGAAANAAFTTATPVRDTAARLSVATWLDPFAASTVADFGDRACRRSNVINFNASVTSFDSNSWGEATSIAGLTEAKVNDFTNLIGTEEGLYGTGKLWSVGRTGTDNNGLCSDKALTASGTDSFANASGICPEAPTQFGGYKMAGAALYAHTNAIRTDITVPASNNRAFKVDTYSVALSTGSPRIKIPVPGLVNKFVFISPSYRLNHPTRGQGGGTLVDFQVVYQTATRGKYVVNWEDSEQGGDFDQDVLGTIEYSVNTTTRVITITTDAIAQATVNPQGFGYAITGTAGKDGVHFHSGVLGFSYNDARNITVTPTATLNISGGCNNCQVNDPPTAASYTMVGVSGESLKDPLWYAAKYGGFDQEQAIGYTPGSGLPVGAWDSKNADGSTGADGVPDNYFLAVDPSQLEQSLSQVFESILKAGGAAPAATSGRNDFGGFAYTSQYQIKTASGSVDAIAAGRFQRASLDATGNASKIIDWEAGAKLTARNWSDKQILTLGAAGTLPFRWASLDDANKSALLLNSQTGIGTTTTSVGQNRLEWIRGNSANETVAGGLRARTSTVLGAIINSTPWYVGAPSAGYSNSQYGGGYGSFTQSNSTTNAVFVAANDGMLHAFNGSTGDEYFAYVPRAMFITSTVAPFSKLSALTRKNFELNSGTGNINVDGSLMAADMKVGGAWGTYLFGSFGRGAKGVYALNVTAPQSISEASTGLARWEFTAAANDADMGFIVGKPSARIDGQPFQTGYMANGKWAAIYGNGYNSTNGNAALFILFADGPSSAGTTTWTTGTHYIKIPTGTAGNGPDNGLAMATAIDSNNDGKIDVIYAGDLKGNVWKFDVSSADSANWRVATTGDVPLYQARSTLNGSSTVVVQPITTVIQPFAHPEGGYQLVFGTGKSFESSDYPLSAPYTNSIYGIHDKPGMTTTITVGLTDLVEQTLTVSNGLRYPSASKVDYATKKGWYTKLPISSEGVVFNPIPEGSTRVLIKSIAPDGYFDGCRTDTIDFLATLDVISGKAIPNAVIGAPLLNGLYASSSSTKNSFEISRAGKYKKIAKSNTDANNNGKTSCIAGTANCICNPGSPAECVICVDRSICELPWEKYANLCTFRTFSQGGDGDVISNFREGACDDGRLTWREIIRNR